MECHESPNVPFTIFRTRFKTGNFLYITSYSLLNSFSIFIDNICKMSRNIDCILLETEKQIEM